MAGGPQEQPARLERRALWVSIVSALILCVLGIAFALESGSEAILLDGVFSGLGFLMALATLYVSVLIKQPDDEHFHFGYAHFAPLVNVIKSALMVVLCGFALLSSVRALLGDGREFAIGMAVVYGLVATLIGAGLSAYLNRAARKSNSVLVALDAKGAIIDTMMSVAVLGSFMLGYLLEGGSMAGYLNYLDPAVVTLLCIFSLPMPLKVLARNGREVLLAAPNRNLQEEVIERVAGALKAFPIVDYRSRMLKMGNTVNVLLHLKLSPDFRLNGVAQLDEMREAVNESLSGMEVRVVADLVFVNDMSLAD